MWINTGARWRGIAGARWRGIVARAERCHRKALMSQMRVRVEIDHTLIARFARPGPRYTSYPTADRLVEAFDAAAHATWLSRRNIGGFARPLSLDVHLPFCASICYYCACDKVITRDHGRSAKYLRYLEKELRLQLAHPGGERRLSQLGEAAASRHGTNGGHAARRGCAAWHYAGCRSTASCTPALTAASQVSIMRALAALRIPWKSALSSTTCIWHRPRRS